MTDTADLNLVIEVPNSAETDGGDNRSVTIDLAAIPQEARLELLKAQVRDVVKNRVNVAMVRNRAVRAPFAEWAAYDAAIAADPLQTLIAKPDGERPTGDVPAALDPIAKAQEAITDLLNGELRTATKRGEGKSRAPKDPLIAAVTNVVARAVFDANKAAGRTLPNKEGTGTRAYSYPDAVKEVGGDGVAYLNAQIDAKVAAAPEGERDNLRKQLEKRRDDQYINPAKIMLGQTTKGKGGDLPSIL